MNGADYRARVRLSTKDDTTLAEVGETCERVPASSLPGLLTSRKIEPVSPTVQPIEHATASPVETRDDNPDGA